MCQQDAFKTNTKTYLTPFILAVIRLILSSFLARSLYLKRGRSLMGMSILSGDI